MTDRFAAYCRRKEAAACVARLPGYITRAETPVEGLVPIGSAWPRALFDGDFYRCAAPPMPGVPVVSIVFVQSRSGNTVAPDPSVFGGGDTDLHLVYEGLSRIDADAVMAGATTARGRELVFSVWHPELVALRLARGRSRHPAQVIVTDRGDLRFDEALIFLEPELPVVILARSAIVAEIQRRVGGRSWIQVIDVGEPISLARGMRALRARGLQVVSCVGGRRTATSLLAEGLITDIYLTTSAIEAGEPNTPYYAGPPLSLHRVLMKDGTGEEAGVRFEHFVVRSFAGGP